MKTEKQQAMAAEAFAKRWEGRGYEKGDSQLYWTELLTEVFGVENPSQFIRYEEQVKVDKTNFIDGHIPSTRVLIEQKSLDKDLRKGIVQSDGTVQNPFQQAKRYVANMPLSEHPRWIVTCNFKEFLVYDMEQPNGEPEQILLENLGKEYYRLQFLVDVKSEHLSKEMEVSMKAGEMVGKIYEKLLEQYIDPTNADSLKSLNILCVRLVFCLYCEDSGVFGKRDMFHDYLVKYDAENMRAALIRLFKVLNTPLEERDPYLMESLAVFPYVSGGLFEEENIEIPRFTDEIRHILLQNASLDFDWSEISPTIFGAVFESTLNPDTRRSGGMHYTSVENIHKVIDPLFLDELRTELDTILEEEKVPRQRKKRLEAYQERLASLTFLDPACGSGNFLTETYLSLRRLENRAIMEETYGQTMLGDFITDPIRVNIRQFYGIEINDFAVVVAKTALWISEAQMMHETEKIIHKDLEFLPLRNYANIREANALRIDWNDVVPKEKLDYIMGNPPFVGFTFMTAEQKQDVASLYPGIKNVDYVSCWFKKACDYTRMTDIECAFVSTNSITQGETVGRMWGNLDVSINFAWPTFRWDNEASEKAHVHCVIIGFSHNEHERKYLYDDSGAHRCNNINVYLADAPNVIVSSRSKSICDVPPMIYGNKPVDGGNLIFTKVECEEFLKLEPKARRWMHTLIGGTELINNKPKLNDKLRYTLWLDGISPSELRSMPTVLERVAACKQTRLGSPAAAIRKFAETPHLYAQRTQPNVSRLNDEGLPILQDEQQSYNLLVPRVSSERRRYVPMGYIAKDVVTNDQVQIIPDATLYHFGILESNVHMAWMRAVCGRLKSDYRYSKDVVYNNFPWPTPTDEQRAKIEQTAQQILDARAQYPDSSLADLYDELTMPVELRRAHQQNDRAVMEAYGFPVKNDFTESRCVAELFKMYKELTKDK